MNRHDARELARPAVIQIAPDADLESYGDEADLCDDLEFDSYDFLGFVAILGDRIGQRIGADDYPRLTTVEGRLDYFAGI